MSDVTHITDREQRVSEIVAAYLEAVDEGNAADWRSLLATYPEYAEDIAAFFQDTDRLNRMAQPIRGNGSRADQTNAVTPTLHRGPPLFDETVLEGPRRFGDYELLQEIARGGMGVVYKAQQLSAHRLVALKMILSGRLASRDDVLRFRAEAEAAAQLDHPNIVPIFDVGECEGQHYFSMKLIEGGSLSEWMKRENPAKQPRWSTAIMAQVARAVHHAHQRGILHRDLKPSNILLQKESRSQEPGARRKADSSSSPGSWILDSGFCPFVTDFGLAKRLEGDSDLTQSGAIVGTPNYMAPEQAFGIRDLTTAADVYSLGAILYELITGQKPFQAGSPLETLTLVREREPDAPRSINQAIDRDLETICLKCLEKFPPRRYPSAEMLAEDLERWQRGEPILARPVTPLERFSKWLRRRPAVAATMAGFAALLVVSISLIVWQWSVAMRERDRAQVGERRAEAALAEAKRNLYSFQIATAQDEFTLSREKGEEVLDAVDEELRGWEWYSLKRSAFVRPFSFNGHAWRKRQPEPEDRKGVMTIAISPNGELIASGGSDRILLVWNPTTCATVRQTAFADPITAIAWRDRNPNLIAAHGSHISLTHGLGQSAAKSLADPDGQDISCLCLRPKTGEIIASGQGPRIRLWDADAGKILATLHSTSPKTLSMSVSSDGKWLAAAGSDRAVTLWDLESHKQLRQRKDFDADLVGIAFSPNREWLAVAHGSNIDLLNPADLTPIRGVQTGGGGTVIDVAFTPDSKRLIASNERDVRFWDPARGQLVWTIKDHLLISPSEIAMSPTGDRLAIAGANDRIRVLSTTPFEPATSIATPDRVFSLSVDGYRLISGDAQRLQLWNSTSGAHLAEWQTPSSVQVTAGVGDLAAAGLANGSVAFSQLNKKEVRSIAVHKASVRLMQWSRDGNSLVTVADDVVCLNRDGQERWRLQQEGCDTVHSIAIDRDGRLLALGMPRQVVVIDLAKGDLVPGDRALPADIDSVGFAGQTPVATGLNNTIYYWVKDHWIHGQIKSARLYDLHARFASAGQRIAWGHANRFVMIFGVPENEDLFTVFAAGDDNFRTMVINTLGTRLAWRTKDGIKTLPIPRK